MKAGAVATPLPFVVTLVDPPKVPLAPLPGAANVTVIPLNGWPPESSTVACSAVANAVFTVALCGVPALAMMLTGVLVRLKLAGVATPDTLAVTV